MIQKDLQGNLWECKCWGTRKSGNTFRAYQQEIERLKEQLELLVKDDETYQETIIRQSKIINKAIEYIESKFNTERYFKGEWYASDIDYLLDILKGVENEK